MRSPALERCVGDVDRFLRDHWGMAPLVLEPSEGNVGFDDLASFDDLDHIVSSLGLRASSLRMVRDGKTLPVSSYTTVPGGRSRAADPPVHAASVYKRFDEGATIVLESLHRYWPALTDFCRDLELSLGHSLQVNAYITPPGSRGFDVHRDSHDVFVLQVSGSKHWLVYGPDDEERPLIDREIQRGAALYIPTGFPHAASAGGRASAHLTVGILTHDSIGVLREIAKEAESDPAFQERLPAVSVRDPAALRETVVGHLDEFRAWLDKLDVDVLTERVARRVMSSEQPILRGQLRQLELIDHLDADTVVAKRRGTICMLFARDTSLQVLLVDRQLEMPLAAHGVMREVAERDLFSVRDLHSHLTPDSALVLVRRLVREGLLEVVVAD